MSKEHQKLSRSLNYIQPQLILVSTITGYLSISSFASLRGVRIGITSSAIGLRICAITPGIKSISPLRNLIKLNSIEVLIFKALNNSYISHDEFVLKDDDTKEEIKHLKASIVDQ